MAEERPAPLPSADLAAYALLQLDNRARKLKSPLHVFLAQLCLLGSDTPMTPSELQEAMASELPHSEGLTDKDVAMVCRVGRESGALRETEGRVELVEARRLQLETAQAQLEAHRLAFEDEVVACVEARRDVAIDPLKRPAFVEGLHAQVQQIFAEQTAQLVRALGDEGQGFDQHLAKMSPKSLNKLAEPLAPPTQKVARAQIVAGVRDAFEQLSVAAQAHLAAVYQRTVVFALLDQDPSIRNVKRSLAQRRQILLDTNVIIAYWFDVHRQHEEAASLIDIARSIKCRVTVSKFTQDELAGRLEASRDTYRRIGSDAATALVDDPMLRAFADRRNRNSKLTFAAFVASYLPPQALLKEQGFDVDDLSWPEAQHDERIAAVTKAVASVSQKSPRVAGFDAKNLVHVQRLRAKRAADAMGSAVFLATMDRSLGRAESQLIDNKTYRVPSSREASDLVEFLSPHATPEAGGLQEYVTYLLKSRLGLISADPVFVDAHFLAQLREAEFDIDEVLEAGPERARQILTQLQEDAEVRALLKAGRPSEGSAEWEQQLAIAVRNALQDIEDSPERRALLDRLRAENVAAAKQAAEAVSQARSATDRVAELEAELAVVQQRQREGIRQRLKAWWSRTFGQSPSTTPKDDATSDDGGV